MPVTQISKIQHRNGLRDDLPALDLAELGFTTDTHELFVGNGTPSNDPNVTNTQIITVLSNPVPGSSPATQRIPVIINGTTYYIHVSTTP